MIFQENIRLSGMPINNRIISFMLLAAFVFTVTPVQASKSKKERIYIVSAESSSFFFTGGLGHVTRDTAQALAEQGYDVTVVIPHYQSLHAKRLPLLSQGRSIPIKLGRSEDGHQIVATFRFNKTHDSETGVKVLLGEHMPGFGYENYFNNITAPGEKPIYTHHAKQGEAFAAFGKALHTHLFLQPEKLRPEIMILNDWTAGPLASLLQSSREMGHWSPKIIGAIHNLGYQGIESSSLMRWADLSPKHYRGSTGLNGIEYHGQVNLLKALIEYSDIVYTVSEDYAQEITTARFGSGLNGVMKRLVEQNRLTGILNGIINSQWNPKKPTKKFAQLLQHKFSAKNLSGKALGKLALQKEYGLPVNANIPVIIMTSRIDQQKGFDYLLGFANEQGALEQILHSQNVQIIICGDGTNVQYMDKIRQLTKKFPDKFRHLPFSNKTEKNLTAYSDFFLNGSWYEPSGLNQFFSMRYGTIPITSNVGGLASSFTHGISGLHFEIAYNHDGIISLPQTASNIVTQISSAIEIFQSDPTKLTSIRTAAMKVDNSWKARIYLLESLIKVVLSDDLNRLAPNTDGKVLSPNKLLELIVAAKPGACYKTIRNKNM